MTETKTKLTVRKDGDKLSEMLKDLLPHGSGIDADWYIRLLPGHGFQCCNSYHVMNCVGFYEGWLDFAVYYRWNEAEQQFEFKRLTVDDKTWLTYDEDGEEYDALELHVTYLEDCFLNTIRPDFTE